LEHYREHDFIWASPPCPSHSICNIFLNAQGIERYPDLKLWQEIIFLKHFFKGKYVVENVKSYYDPMFTPYELDRHYFWSNFYISPFKIQRDFNFSNARSSTRQKPEDYGINLQDFLGISLDKNVKNKNLLLRNCVHPKLGEHIFKCAYKYKQIELF